MREFESTVHHKINRERVVADHPPQFAIQGAKNFIQFE
jgi:hypothetical protein